MKYRKKPVVIDATQFSGSPESISELMDWTAGLGDEFFEHFILVGGPESGAPSLRVKTLEGTSYDVPTRHYIIRGVKGEYYPCAPDIFEQTYSKLSDEDLLQLGRDLDEEEA